jgi:hypothetical protein
MPSRGKQRPGRWTNDAPRLGGNEGEEVKISLIALSPVEEGIDGRGPGAEVRSRTPTVRMPLVFNSFGILASEADFSTRAIRQKSKGWSSGRGLLSPTAWSPTARTGFQVS